MSFKIFEDLDNLESICENDEYGRERKLELIAKARAIIEFLLNEKELKEGLKK